MAEGSCQLRPPAPCPWPCGRRCCAFILPVLPDCAAEGALAAERPASAAEIRLIGAGKFLDNSASLSSERGPHKPKGCSQCMAAQLPRTSRLPRTPRPPRMYRRQPAAVPPQLLAHSLRCWCLPPCRPAARAWRAGGRHRGHAARSASKAAAAETSRWGLWSGACWVVGVAVWLVQRRCQRTACQQTACSRQQLLHPLPNRACSPQAAARAEQRMLRHLLRRRCSRLQIRNWEPQDSESAGNCFSMPR